METYNSVISSNNIQQCHFASNPMEIISLHIYDPIAVMGIWKEEDPEKKGLCSNI